MMDQRLMRLAAEKQADERSAREGGQMYVYREAGYPTADDVTWYVVNATESLPRHAKDATLEYSTEPKMAPFYGQSVMTEAR